MEIPSAVKTALNRLTEKGYSAYIVGGCVRDALRGVPPHDWDITTDAVPEQIMAAFENTTPTGLRYGTITAVVDGMPLEITTFRHDCGYSDRRRPDYVEFTRDIVQDLARRDFTINAIAMDTDGKTIDPFGGQVDIRRKIIKCVGDPEARLKEDTLRIARALRFASTLCFKIERDTREAAERLKERLSSVSPERIRTELDKMLAGDNIGYVLKEYAPVFLEIIPELKPTVGYNQNNQHHEFSLYEHIRRSVAAAPPHLRLVMLLHDIGKPPTRSDDSEGISHYRGHPRVGALMADSTLRRLKYDNTTREFVVNMVEIHDKALPQSDAGLKRWLSKMGEGFFDLLKIRRADAVSRQNAPCDLSELDALRVRARKIIESGDCLTLRRLKIDGDDLKQIGFPEGRAIGEVLRRLLDEVIEQKIPNERDALIVRAKEIGRTST